LLEGFEEVDDEEEEEERGIEMEIDGENNKVKNIYCIL